MWLCARGCNSQGCQQEEAECTQGSAISTSPAVFHKAINNFVQDCPQLFDGEWGQVGELQQLYTFSWGPGHGFTFKASKVEKIFTKEEIQQDQYANEKMFNLFRKWRNDKSNNEKPYCSWQMTKELKKLTIPRDHEDVVKHTFLYIINRRDIMSCWCFFQYLSIYLIYHLSLSTSI